jgi:hypothetical protein
MALVTLEGGGTEVSTGVGGRRVSPIGAMVSIAAVALGGAWVVRRLFPDQRRGRKQGEARSLLAILLGKRH